MKEEKIFKSGLEGALELYGEMEIEEEIDCTGNSFFDRNYFGTRILILAPCAGDEINIAGNVTANFSRAKAEIFIAYSTKIKNKNEIFSALKILGVEKDKIIFLNCDNLKAELKNLILDLRANIIFCSECEGTKNHKILSLTFEEIMGEILKNFPQYTPEVYKKFAYATAFETLPDFYSPNLLSVKPPKVGATDTYDFDLIDRANFLWSERVRFPVVEPCQKTLLKNNPVADSIFAYKSLKNELHALRILNSDEIFFERRTDNKIFSAKVTATSGDVQKVCDFKIINTQNAKETPLKISNHIWKPNKNDAEKILKIEWAEGVQAERILIFGNILSETETKIKIKCVLDNFRADFSDAGIKLTNIFETEKILPCRGLPLKIDFDKKFLKSVEINPVDCGEDFGISEIEIFSNIEPLRKIQPFIKLTAGEEFFYHLDIPYEIEKIPLKVYRFHVDEPVKISAEVNGEKILTEVLKEPGDELILNFGDAEKILLNAEVTGNPNIYDCAIIRRVGDVAQIQLKILQWIDKLRLRKIRGI